MVELLVVIAILGLLAGGVLALVKPAEQFQKARDAQRKSDLAQIQRVLEQFYNDNGRYPYSSGADGFNGTDSCVIGDPGQERAYRIAEYSDISGCIDWGNKWIAYKTTIPKDPTSSSRVYVYYVIPQYLGGKGQSYWLYANLERGSNDPQICKNLDGNGECPSVSINAVNAMATKYCGIWPNLKPCNYGVSSPNTKP